jgi:sigma-E factor negative regulatory protein RseB
VFTLSYPRHHDARHHDARPHGRREGRSPLLVAVALVVAVPGFLVAACSSQPGSGTSQSDAATAASPSVAAPGRAAAPGRRQGGASQGGASQSSARQSSTRKSSAQAVRLLNQAASAAILMSYQGEEVVTRWINGSGSVLVSDIWHVSGGQTVTQTLAAGTSFSSQPYLSWDTDGQTPEGVLGVTLSLVQLLEAHYIVVYAGTGSADSRTAQVVEARTQDGSLAARFWLDDATKLPLEREVFDSAANVISQDVFLNVRFVNQAQVTAPSVGGVADPAGPWTGPLSNSQLLALHAQGWLVPAGLPGGLSLFTGAQTSTSTGTVIDLDYSDGLSVVSVFEQRGALAATLAGWQKATVDGHVIYIAEPDQRSVTWSSRGMVYTVMADAPAQTVDAVIGALPHDAPPGFWKRMSRGFVRLASWVNPFR